MPIGGSTRSLALAERTRVPVERVDRAGDSSARRAAACTRAWSPRSRPPRDYGIEDLVAAAAAEPPLLVVLDGIEDPHNVGAILRTVDAAGCDGVVRQSRHAAPLDGAAAKASAGAVSHVRIATEVVTSRGRSTS